MINQVIERVKETINTENVSTKQFDILEANNDKLHSPILAYVRLKGTANVWNQISTRII